MPKLPNLDELKEHEQYQIWRKRNRVRLIDVAKYCGCCASTISQWETGVSNISNELLASYNEYIKQFEKGRI